MSPLITLLHAPGRSARTWIATGVFGLLPDLVSADHLGSVGPARGGLDWTSWLLVVGAVAAVSLAAWAFFAPDRPDGRSASPPPDRSESEPPAR